MIPLSIPNINGNELKYVTECLNTGWVSSVGAYVSKFEEKIRDYVNSKYSVATSSGTTALHISLLLAGVKNDEYVIAPNITFVASINSIRYIGANPLLVDVNEEDWQMDLDLLHNYLYKNTELKGGKLFHLKDGKKISAILPVHILGNMGDIEKLIKISEEFNLPFIEDSTEALGTFFDGKHSGTFGLAGSFSFNGNKIITTGGGGMIVTDNKEFADKAKHLTTQAKADNFEYFHDDIGYNYRLVNVLAAIGVAQMEKLPEFVKKKQYIAEFYKKHLEGVGDISFPEIHPKVNSNNWLFTIRSSKKDQILEELNNSGYQSRPLWIPMNELPAYRNNLYVNNEDISKKLYNSCVSIPCSTNIEDEQLIKIIEKIKDQFI